MKLKINGREIANGGLFAFDGCHKLYLIEDANDETEARKMGYDLYPIAELAEKWAGACPLRFVYNWKLTKKIVSQDDNDAAEIEVRG